MTPEQEFEFRYRYEQEQKQKAQKSIYEKQAEAGTGFDNFLPAVGGAMYTSYLGGKQMLMKGLDAFDNKGRAKAMEPDIQENRDAMAGLTSTKMGMAGDIVGNVAMAIPTMLNPAAATLRGPGSDPSILHPCDGAPPPSHPTFSASRQ